MNNTNNEKYEYIIYNGGIYKVHKGFCEELKTQNKKIDDLCHELDEKANNEPSDDDSHGKE